MTRCGLVLSLAALAACREARTLDGERAAAPFAEIAVDTAPGLSGLSADDDGGLWTVAERAGRAYRIALDAAMRPTVEEFAVEGVPARTDLEAIAALGGGRFALGTEAHTEAVATVLLAERRGSALVVTRAIELSARAVGLPLAANEGAEGACGDGDTIVAALEATASAGQRRWAPLIRIAGGAIARTHRLWLTTSTGDISALDCRLTPDGGIAGWAIERHFAVTRLLRFTLPPVGAGAADVTPTIALDLGPVLKGRLNLEGIAELPDGRLVAVVDNQWKTITGPSQLLVFRRRSP